jgi:hypothetical protein
MGWVCRCVADLIFKIRDCKTERMYSFIAVVLEITGISDNEIFVRVICRELVRKIVRKQSCYHHQQRLSEIYHRQ